MPTFHEHHFADTREKVLVANWTVAMRGIGNTLVMFFQVDTQTNIALVTMEIVLANTKT